MGYDKKQLKELTKPLYGFGGKIIEPVRVITLPASFDTPKNPHTEYITFDDEDMQYPYNAIFRWVLLSYPVPRKRERSLHTCAQDVQITRMATI
jgi:hypothetical protein